MELYLGQPASATTLDINAELRKAYYTDTTAKLRAGSKLFTAKLINIKGEFIDPYTKDVIKGPIVDRNAKFIPPNQRVPQPIGDIKLTNISKSKVQELIQATTKPNSPTSAQVSNAQPLSPPPVQSNLGGATPRRFTPPPAHTTTPSTSQTNSLELEDILNTLRSDRTAQLTVNYSTVKEIDYIPMEPEDKRKLDWFLKQQQSKADWYYDLLNVPYNENTTLDDLIRELRPSDDHRHVTCFRPVVDPNDERYEYICEQILILFILHSKHTIKMSSFQYTNDNIVKALMIAQKFGVKVEVVLNPVQLGQTFCVAASHEMGIDVYINCRVGGVNHFHHDKVLIFDDKYISTGSYNISNNALKNFENFTISKSHKFINAYIARFESLKQISTLYNPPDKYYKGKGCARN